MLWEIASYIILGHAVTANVIYIMFICDIILKIH